jgi:hypothetical protein
LRQPAENPREISSPRVACPLLLVRANTTREGKNMAITDIQAQVAAWRERTKMTPSADGSAPAVQKFESHLSPFHAMRTQRTPEETAASYKNNGIWMNQESMTFLMTGQEIMNMSRDEVRALVAGRRDGSIPQPDFKLSEEGERFTAAATQVRDRIREIMTAQGHDPGTAFTFGMFDGTPRITANKNRMWIDAPTKEIGQMIINLWATRATPAARTD